jgi:hypothetical protein
MINTVAAIWLLVLCVPVVADDTEELRLLEVRKIWDQAPHNAFTDLIRHQDHWMCVFREGQSHVSPDGALRVIQSDDAIEWQSVALIRSENSDLRDAKISVMPDGRLMLLGAESLHQPQSHRHQSLVWFSDDGRQWSEEHEVGQPDNWIWRMTWHDGSAFGFGYGCRDDNRGISLFRTTDGKSFDRLVEKIAVAGTYPNETSIVFSEDGTATCLLRQDGEPREGFIGRSSAPYLEWTWKKLNAQIGGPHLIRLPDKRLLAAVRLYDAPVRTSLCWLDADKGTLTEALRMTSGGDTSYAGMVWHDDRLWVSYYSSHEGRSAIYLAQVAVNLQSSSVVDGVVGAVHLRDTVHFMNWR